MSMGPRSIRIGKASMIEPVRGCMLCMTVRVAEIFASELYENDI
jgi:hypothetical protein